MLFDDNDRAADLRDKYRETPPCPFGDDAAQSADDEALANIDEFQNWLAGECVYQTAVRSDDLQHQVRFDGPFDLTEMQRQADRATVAQLMHTALTTANHDRCHLVMQEIKRRYLAAMFGGAQ